MKKFLVLFFALLLAVSASASLFYPDYFIYMNADINGEDINVSHLWASDGNIGVLGVDTLFVTNTYAIDVNLISIDVWNDANFQDIGVAQGAYFNRINATGDSNFTNIKTSGDIHIVGGENSRFVTASDEMRFYAAADSGFYFYTLDPTEPTSQYFQLVRTPLESEALGLTAEYWAGTNADIGKLELWYGNIEIHPYYEAGDGNIIMYGNTVPATATSKLGQPTDRWPEIWATNINATGDSNFTNIEVSQGAYLNRLNVSGDANFSGLQSDYIFATTHLFATDGYIDQDLVVGNANQGSVSTRWLKMPHGSLDNFGILWDADGWIINGEIEDNHSNKLKFKMGTEEFIIMNGISNILTLNYVDDFDVGGIFTAIGNDGGLGAVGDSHSMTGGKGGFNAMGPSGAGGNVNITAGDGPAGAFAGGDGGSVNITAGSEGGGGSVGADGLINLDGDITVTEFIEHALDPNTYIKYTEDSILLTAGGIAMVRCSEGSTDRLELVAGAGADIWAFSNATSGENPSIHQAGYISNGSNEVEILWTVKDTDDYFWLERENTNILGFGIDMDTNITENLTVDGNYGAYGEYWSTYHTHKIEMPVAGVYHFIGGDWNSGDFYNMTLDSDSNCMTIGQDGMYLINVSLSFTGSQNVTYDFAIFVNGVMGGSVNDRDMHITRTTSINAEGSVSISGTKRLSIGDTLDLRVEQVTAANKEITISNVNFTTVRVG